MRVQFVRKRKNCAYPPIGKYSSNEAFKGDFEDVQVTDDGFEFRPLRPEGSRQPAAEADILANLRARAQGRAAFPDACITRGGYK